MQRYSFRVTEGKYSDSDLAVDLPDRIAARKEALAMCIGAERSARHANRRQLAA